jgi:hypothetical protein
MNARQLGFLAVTFAAGFLAASFVPRGERPEPSPPAERDTSTSTDTAKVDVAALRTSYERRIAELESQNEALRLQAEKTTPKTPAALSIGERLKEAQARHRTNFELAKQRETDKLLAAGYSMERIEWIRRRTEELLADYRRANELARQKGRQNAEVMAAHSLDSDIDLRREMGDEEYARYRQALGRSIGVPVSGLIPGGSGEAAGLRPGDEIIAYNGVRVFNMGELTPLLRQSMTSGASMPVDVLRDGQKLRLDAAGGDLRISTPPPVMATEDLRKLMEDTNARMMERARADAQK